MYEGPEDLTVRLEVVEIQGQSNPILSPDTSTATVYILDPEDSKPEAIIARSNNSIIGGGGGQ